MSKVDVLFRFVNYRGFPLSSLRMGDPRSEINPEVNSIEKPSLMYFSILHFPSTSSSPKSF